MIKFLLDANLSVETAQFLRDRKFNVKSLLEENLGQISDQEVAKIACKEGRIIITHDLDFGEIYHFKEEEKLGILILRLKDQTVEAVNKILGEFLKNKIIQKQKLDHSLIILAENSYRTYKS
ncbi:MAG TPA: DUF5615 family PIN-like protein [Candidatus Bathyarchaeia archaeon]|nr:DUF5615 family PIN-like protein [Candidatus Bathyarchaeia archaeon]